MKNSIYLPKQFFLLLIFTFSFIDVSLKAQQHLKAGFDALEYIEMSVLNNEISGFPTSKIPVNRHYELKYKSSPSKLDNVWAYFKHKEKTLGVFVIRGTSGNANSWLENFYAAMIPAKGTLSFKDRASFEYSLADRSDATIHVGWTLGFSYMVDSLSILLESEIKSGITEFIVTGHSQGGAIAYYMSSWIKRKYPSLTVKVYCSAAPKPGNTAFAYDFEFLFRDGWAYNVVNELDWVPEMPFSIQTMNDFNVLNPFKNLKKVIQKQKIPVKWFLKKYYNDLSKSSTKAQEKFQKRLGKTMGKFIQKYDESVTLPSFSSSHHYARAGHQIILKATESYRAKYPSQNEEKVFLHHAIPNYVELVEQWYKK